MNIVITDRKTPDYQLDETLAFIRKRLPQNWQPDIAIICGSGLGGLGARVQHINSEMKQLVVDYKEIPHFSRTSVPGHAGKLVFGSLGEKRVVCMVGRFHFYEGHELKNTTYPIRIFSLLGVKCIIVTNAAGSLNSAKLKNGDIMVIKDHVNMPGLGGNNPLIGVNMDRFGPRFPAMSDAYNYNLRKLAIDSYNELGFEAKTIHQGTYVFVAGPSYETPAEAKFLKLIGADAVGMSTVPEVLVARHCGMAVLGLSLITNKVFLPEDIEIMESGKAPVEKANHEEVLSMSKERALVVETLVERIISKINEQI